MASSRLQKKEREDHAKRQFDTFPVVITSHARTLFNKCGRSRPSHLKRVNLSLAPQLVRLVLSLSLPRTQVTDDCSVIGRNLFKKETNLQLFVGLKVTLSTGESGVIEGGFGQSGKFKIRIPGKGFPVSVGWSRSAHGSFCLPSLIHTHTLSELALQNGSRIRGHFSGCGKSGRPDILSHIPRIPLGIAAVPGEVCAVFILPSVALNPAAVQQEGREKPNV